MYSVLLTAALDNHTTDGSLSAVQEYFHAYCSKGSLLYFIIAWYCPNIYI